MKQKKFKPKSTSDARDILAATDIKVNLTEEKVQLTLEGLKDSPVSIGIPYEQLTNLEAVLLRLQYAKEVILPGQNTSQFFKKNKKEGKGFYESVPDSDKAV